MTTARSEGRLGLRRTGRAAHELFEPEIFGTQPHGTFVVDQGQRRRGEGHLRLEEIDHVLDLGRAELVMQGRGQRAAAPAGTVEDEGLPPVRHLPRHHVAPPDPYRPQAARQPGHHLLELLPVEAPIAVDQHGARLGRPLAHDRVEHRDVPGTAGCAIAAGIGGLVRGTELHRVAHTTGGPRGVEAVHGRTVRASRPGPRVRC